MSENSFQTPIVFVLGAGFTRSFDSDAPLINCKIDLPYFKRKYKNFQGAKKVLDQVYEKDGFVNMEKLLSRLYTGMPYDHDFLPQGERQILYSDLKDFFLKQIATIKSDDKKLLILENFARYILKNKASCITFNYDDMLDQALFHADMGNVLDKKTAHNTSWTPMRGYGFFIDSAESLAGNGIMSFTKSQSLLLKMHGSINWFPKRGYKDPFPMDSIVHNQNWWPLTTQELDKDIIHHYEASPVIIPPIFDKSFLTGNSIFKVIWSRAFEILSEAKTVVFIGYSFPDTDFVVANLFTEALFKKIDKKIIIINRGSNPESLKTRYRTILSQYSEKDFEFTDAAKWIEEKLV